jgi:vacuolar-type H+-ATPase subunit I/STV1
MTLNGLLPWHHRYQLGQDLQCTRRSNNGNGNGNDNNIPHNTDNSSCPPKKSEASMLMVIGLVVVVLISTQTVLSAIVANPPSHQLTTKKNSYQKQSTYTSTTPQDVIGDTHHLHPATPSTINTHDNDKWQYHDLLQRIGWMQAVVEFRVEMANIASDMEKDRRNHQNEIEEKAQMGDYTMDISSLYDLVSEMVRCKYKLSTDTKNNLNVSSHA